MLHTSKLFLIGGLALVASTPRLVFKDPLELALTSNDPVALKAQIWLVVMWAQVPVWAGALGFALSAARRILPIFRYGRLLLFGTLLVPPLLLLLGSLLLKTLGIERLGGFQISSSFPALVRLGMFAGGTTVGVMLAIALAVQRERGAKTRVHAVVDILKLHQLLETAMLFAVVILGLSTIATGQLRLALNAGNPAGKPFLEDNVVLWGLSLTCFLAIFYIPARVALGDYGRSVKERLQGTVPDERTTLVPWLEADDKLDQFLKLRLTDWSSLAGGLGTLVPLFLGWISSTIK